jgi:F-type H+-transporting ATPase subunit d
LPEIDFAFYKGRLSNPAIADEYEKAYKALAVAYPKDKGNVKAQIDEQEKLAQEVTKKQIADARKSIDEAKALLGKIDSVPSPDVMTQEMYAEYFPEQALNPWERPTFWPHTKSYQPENDPHTIK